MFIGWLASAKKPETRARRVAKAIDMLERGVLPMDQYRRPKKT
jgi:uncharacterized protein YdeI (YjbR/CyaY-like superfamily)